MLWYRHLFQTERGRDCLARHRAALCRLLWTEWCPDWRYDDATFARTASFENPHFADVVIHAYRNGFGLAAGDPALEGLEDRLAGRPDIAVPAVALDGLADPLKPGGTAGEAGKFAARHEHRLVAAGHNLPQEAPAASVDAVLTVHGWT